MGAVGGATCTALEYERMVPGNITSLLTLIAIVFFTCAQLQFRHNSRVYAPVICMGAIYLYDWYSRYAPSHLYEGTISASKIGIIPILKSIRRTTQFIRSMDSFIHVRSMAQCPQGSCQNQYRYWDSA